MIEATVRGTADFREALTSIPRKLRRRALLNALKKGARLVQAEARSRTPVLRLDLQSPYRKPGTVKKAIAVRTSKLARRAGDVGVFVNVRPASGAKFSKSGALKSASKRGALSPNDPFYWRFINFGTRKLAGAHFLEGGAAKLGQALTVIEQDLGAQIQRLDTNPKDEL